MRLESRPRTSEQAGALLFRITAITEDTHRPFWLASILIHAAYYFTHKRDVEGDYAYSSNSTYGNAKTKTIFIVLFTISA